MGLHGEREPELHSVHAAADAGDAAAVAKERGLSAAERREIRTWLKSLPWLEGGWLPRLPAGDGRTREWGYRPLLDNCDRLDGGLIELHFSW